MRTLEEIVNEACPSPANSEAWNRQRITAKAVAERFADGFRTVLLADEVGMGKTYTALAVMANYIFQSDINDRRVILIVPANHVLASKWEQEIHNFNSTYLREERLKSKRLRPIALDGIMELVKNLHDYESNAKIQRQPEYLKN